MNYLSLLEIIYCQSLIISYDAYKEILCCQVVRLFYDSIYYECRCTGLSGFPLSFLLMFIFPLQIYHDF